MRIAVMLVLLSMTSPTLGQDASAPIGFELDGVKPFMAGAEIEAALTSNGYSKSLLSSTRGGMTTYYEKPGNRKTAKDQVSFATHDKTPAVSWFLQSVPREMCFDFVVSKLGPGKCADDGGGLATVCKWDEGEQGANLAVHHFPRSSRGQDMSDCRINLSY